MAASGPALYRSYDDARGTAPDAFESVEQWRTWGDMRTRTGALKDLRLRIDCGESDQFAPALASLRERMPDPAAVTISQGCHDRTYWRSVAPAQLKLIGEALTPPKTRHKELDRSAARTRTWNIRSKGEGVADYTTADCEASLTPSNVARTRDPSARRASTSDCADDGPPGPCVRRVTGQTPGWPCRSRLS